VPETASTGRAPSRPIARFAGAPGQPLGASLRVAIRSAAGAERARETKTVRSRTRGWLEGLGRDAASADLRSLGLLRWVLGALLIADVVDRLGLVDTLYSNDGVLSNHYSLFRPLAPYQFSLYASLSSTRDVTVAFVLTMVVYACFAIGYRTRVFHLLSFVCVTSLHSRNLMAELPSDVPLHLWVGWSLFLPLGARFSIDSVRRSLVADRETSVQELNFRGPNAARFTSIAVVGLLLQISALHIASALRQAGPTWQDGSALYYALRQNLWVTDLGSFIGQHVPVHELRALSSGYRAIGMAIGALLLVPTVSARRACLALLIVFHLASRALWNFGLYEWVMLGVAPILVSSEDWDKVRAWYAKRKTALVVYVDPDCGIYRSSVRLLKRLDAVSRLTFAASSITGEGTEAERATLPMLVVRDEAKGRTLEGCAAVAAVVDSLPAGGPLSLALRIPGVSWAVDQACEIVARRRTAISAWFGLNGFGEQRAPTHERSLADSPWRSLFRALTLSREGAAVLFACVCALALFRDMGDDTPPSTAETIAYRIVAYPRLFQRWGLFAPDPPMRPGTLVAEAQTAGGARLDPFTGLPIAASSSSQATLRPRPHPLLSAYFTSISQPSRSTYVNELREYVRRLGDRRGPTDKLVWFNIDWIEAPIPAPDGRDSPTELAAASLPRRITSGP
jgi:predicted DCC family thiol-disulfide oxidoreductase YuxK